MMKEKVFTSSDYAIFMLLTCLSLAAILYFLLHWFSFGDLLAHPIVFFILSLLVLVKIANSQARWFTLLLMKRPHPIMPKPGLQVAVVTTIVPGSESLEMLEQTLKALMAMDYPHDTPFNDRSKEAGFKLSLSRGASVRRAPRLLAYQC